MPLDRVLEPELMDNEQDAVEYDSMDFSEVNTAFALRALELAPPSGRVIDIGTGTARIPILMLQRGGNNLQVHAIDLSQEMLKLGKRNVEEANLQDRISLELADAKNMTTSKYTFDLVISNSLAHHIPEPSEFFKTVAALAGERAGILIRDLIRPDSEDALNELVSNYASDCDEYQRKLFRDSLRASLTMQEVEGYLTRARINGAALVQPSDRHWSVERAWRSS